MAYKKVYLETFGCQMNVSDSERVATLLEKEGYEITRDENSADVILINTCSVREKAEQKLFTRIGEIRHERSDRPMIGAMGCVAQLEGEMLFGKIEGLDFVVGTKAVGRVHHAIENFRRTELPVLDLGERESDYDWSVSETQRHSPCVAFLPIIEGCNKFCTYCIVPFSRGREKSFEGSEIVQQVNNLRREGVKEVHLIGQNVNSYRPTSDSGLEKFAGRSPFAKLLRAVAATGIERVKFATSFPRDFTSEIVDAMNQNENLCNWVHLPVQSGSDKVLAAMKRGHTAENYKKRADAIRNSPRGISLTTDIIVGFPGETDEDFRKTIDIFNYCEFDGAYIFKYSPRPGTPAFAMGDDVLPETKTQRFNMLEELRKKFVAKRQQSLIGQTLSVLVEKTSTRTVGGFSGHSTCHRLVNFIGEGISIGAIADVVVRESKVNSLYGELE
jgi:tRNA-2-methylthio-N6-dimethylallyladenosine synthase